MFMGQYLPYFAFRANGQIHFSMNIGGQKSLLSTISLTNNTWYNLTFVHNYDGTNNLLVQGIPFFVIYPMLQVLNENDNCCDEILHVKVIDIRMIHNVAIVVDDISHNLTLNSMYWTKRMYIQLDNVDMCVSAHKCL